MLTASGFMLFVEFFADKIPGIDSLWDLVHTLVRIPAGAALAAAVFGADPTVWTMAAALLGGTIAAPRHFSQATARGLHGGAANGVHVGPVHRPGAPAHRHR